MAQRSKRGFVKTDEVMQKLAQGRKGAIQVCTEAKIKSDVYQAANKTIDAIDNLADTLTGRANALHDKIRTADPKQED